MATFFRPYDDLPPIQGNFDFQIDTPYLSYKHDELPIDPNVTFSYHHHDHLKHFEHRLEELGHFIDGRPPPLAIPYNAINGHGLYQPPPNQYHHLRYVSPTGPYGGSLSSTGSSPHDYALSPETTHSTALLAAQPLPSYPLGSNLISWPTSAALSGGFPSPAPTTYSMKDLQIKPDTFEDDMIKVAQATKAPSVILTTRPASPATSSLETSVYNSPAADGGDSDKDAEYLPSRAARQSTKVGKRAPARRNTRASPRSETKSAIIDPKARITKPASAPNRSYSTSTKKAKRRSKTPKRSVTSKINDSTPTKTRNFICTFHHYGCTSKFVSKNEWKRHVASQHLQLGIYRCDHGKCCVRDDDDHHDTNKHYNATGHRNRRQHQQDMPNDFNRKDLFTSHMKRMHKPWSGEWEKGKVKAKEEFVREVVLPSWERCWMKTRDAPSRSCCGFCEIVFDDDHNDDGLVAEDHLDIESRDVGMFDRMTSRVGTSTVAMRPARGTTWEERMEHVGKHFEKRNWDLEVEREDEDLTLWAIAEGIVVDWGSKGKWLTGIDPDKQIIAGADVDDGGIGMVNNDGLTLDEEEEDAHGEDE